MYNYSVYRLIFFLTAACFFPVSYCSDESHVNESGISWADSIESAYTLAEKTRRPILINFHSKDCPPCIRMKNEFFMLHKFGDFINKFELIPVTLDADRYPDEMEKFVKDYNVYGLPTLLLLDFNKKEIGRSEGFRSSSRTLMNLYGIMNEWKRLKEEL